MTVPNTAASQTSVDWGHDEARTGGMARFLRWYLLIVHHRMFTFLVMGWCKLDTRTCAQYTEKRCTVSKPSMQGSVRNAGIQSRRLQQAQTHHERPWNCAVGGKGMWVSIEMGRGREKCFIDEAVRLHTAGGGTLRARCSGA